MGAGVDSSGFRVYLTLEQDLSWKRLFTLLEKRVGA